MGSSHPYPKIKLNEDLSMDLIVSVIKSSNIVDTINGWTLIETCHWLI